MVGVDSLLRDRYLLKEKIAGGGMGTVFEARDEKLDRDVAIKLLASNLAEDEKFVERFRREARAAAGLRHPNIANVFDAGDEDGCHFIVMELAEGRDLARVLREEGPLVPERAVKVVDQICLALGHAHAAGIVHRDVKPANVIVGHDDSVKVTDFGIARATNESSLTVTGSLLGTAQYISPEQAEGKPLTASSDIYSLGIVTFETLTGAVPYTGESLMSVAMRHINDTVPAPSTITASVPPELDAIVARATEKDPTRRFGDATEMHEALSAALLPENTTTAVLPLAAATEPQSTVWPIPGARWDPVSLGRKVLIVFAFLGLVALALLVYRLGSADAPTATPKERSKRSAPAGGNSASANSMIGTDVIGMDYEAVQTEIAAAGFESDVQFLEGEELVSFIEDQGVSADSAEEGEVVGTDPPTGSALVEGQTITLFVSSGLDLTDEGDEPHGKAKGHDKKDKDD